MLKKKRKGRWIEVKKERRREETGDGLIHWLSSPLYNILRQDFFWGGRYILCRWCTQILPLPIQTEEDTMNPLYFLQWDTHTKKVIPTRFKNALVACQDIWNNTPELTILLVTFFFVSKRLAVISFHCLCTKGLIGVPVFELDASQERNAPQRKHMAHFFRNRCKFIWNKRFTYHDLTMC